MVDFTNIFSRIIISAHLNKNSKDLNKLNNKNLKLFKFDLIKIKILKGLLKIIFLKILIFLLV